MLIIERILINDNIFIHRYSNDNHYLIRNDGVTFKDAIDPLNSKYTYIESSETYEDENNKESNEKENNEEIKEKEIEMNEDKKEE